MRENAGEYSIKGLEARKPSVETPRSLIEPMAKNIEFARGHGDLVIEANGFSIALNYGRSTDSKYTLESLLEMFPLSGRSIAKKITEFQEWKTLDGLIIADSEGRELFNLNEESRLMREEKEGPQSTEQSFRPHSIVVMFPVTNRTPEARMKTSMAFDLESPDHSYIVLAENIASPRTIISLFHELGHTKNFTEGESSRRYEMYLKTLDRNRLTPEERDNPHIEEKIVQTVLEHERSAWAYALNALRPIIRGGVFDKNEILQFVHDTALQSYSNRGQLILNPTLRERVVMKIISFINKNVDLMPRARD